MSSLCLSLSLSPVRHLLLIRHPLPVPYLHHAAERETEVANEVAHRDVVVVGVDAEPSYAFGAGLPFRESENVLGEVETKEFVGNGETMHDDVGLAVAEPLAVNLFVIGILAEHDGGVGGRFSPFDEIMPLMFPFVVVYGLLVRVAVLPLVEPHLFHPVLRLPDDFHDVIDMVERGVEVNGPTGTQKDFGGFFVIIESFDQFFLAPKFYLLLDFVNGLESNLFAVKSGAGIDDVDLVGELVQVQRRARAHIEHPFVTLPVVSDPSGIGALLQRDGRVGLHVGGRETELVSVSEPLDDGSGDVVGEEHGGFKFQVSGYRIQVSSFKVEAYRIRLVGFKDNRFIVLF